MKNYPNVTIFNHPLIQHKIAILRNEKTAMKEFRELIEEITMVMSYEAFRDCPTETVRVKTPLEECEQQMICDKSIAIVPILRAGLGMVNGVHNIFPGARVGHIGNNRLYVLKCQEGDIFMVVKHNLSIINGAVA